MAPLPPPPHGKLNSGQTLQGGANREQDAGVGVEGPLNELQ